jgi:hypothetical protein
VRDTVAVRVRAFLGCVGRAFRLRLRRGRGFHSQLPGVDGRRQVVLGGGGEIVRHIHHPDCRLGPSGQRWDYSAVGLWRGGPRRQPRGTVVLAKLRCCSCRLAWRFTLQPAARPSRHMKITATTRSVTRAPIAALGPKRNRGGVRRRRNISQLAPR